MSISITKVAESKVGSVDFDNLPFGKIFTDHMYVAEYADGKWQNGEIKPMANFSVHPANMAWHYGQAIFEGMKASKHQDGTPMLFRAEEHAKRINASARRMCMAEYPEDAFVEAVTELVKLEQAWIPPQAGSALYLRPFMIATDEFIGVRPSETYKFIIFACPVGPYYAKPVSLIAEDTYARACNGGTGEAKAAGNYAGSLYPAGIAKQKGYDQVMWMDPVEFKYIQEVGTMNIFFVMNGEVYTPDLNGSILHGITRKSMIEVMRAKGYKVHEAPLSIDTVIEAYDKGQLDEVWGTGTAAVISMVNKIKAGDKVMTLDSDGYKIGPMLKATIDGMRAGTVEDEFGWTQRV